MFDLDTSTPCCISCCWAPGTVPAPLPHPLLRGRAKAVLAYGATQRQWQRGPLLPQLLCLFPSPVSTLNHVTFSPSPEPPTVSVLWFLILRPVSVLSGPPVPTAQSPKHLAQHAHAPSLQETAQDSLTPPSGTCIRHSCR